MIKACKLALLIQSEAFHGQGDACWPDGFDRQDVYAFSSYRHLLAPLFWLPGLSACNLDKMCTACLSISPASMSRPCKVTKRVLVKPKAGKAWHSSCLVSKQHWEGGISNAHSFRPTTSFQQCCKPVLHHRKTQSCCLFQTTAMHDADIDIEGRGRHNKGRNLTSALTCHSPTFLAAAALGEQWHWEHRQAWSSRSKTSKRGTCDDAGAL